MNQTPITFTPGKFYRTRDGRKARIYATDGGISYSLHGATLDGGEWMTRSWTKSGVFNRTSLNEGLDLIAEWIDKPEGSK